jgi:unsaturated rhamnogalacturonyl hydrolase
MTRFGFALMLFAAAAAFTARPARWAQPTETATPIASATAMPSPTQPPTAAISPTVAVTVTLTPTSAPPTSPPPSPTATRGGVIYLPYAFRGDPWQGRVVARTMRMTGGSMATWGWESGVAMAGLMYAYQDSGDPKILDHVAAWTDARLADGVTFSQPNDTTPGWAVAMLYRYRPRPAYHDVLDRAVRYLEQDAHRVDGGIAHTADQLWDDTLMNSVPLLAHYAVDFDRPATLDMAADQVLTHARHLQDPATGLWYHGWDGAQSDPLAAHMSAAFWARGNAWAAVATTELLAVLPADHPKRQAVRDVLDRQLRGLVGAQDRSGLWHTVITRPDFYTETSGSAGSAAAILRAADAGWIDADLAAAGRQAREAVRRRINSDGTVTGVSAGTGVAPTIEIYNGIATDQIQPYGQGLYLLLSSAAGGR